MLLVQRHSSSCILLIEPFVDFSQIVVVSWICSIINGHDVANTPFLSYFIRIAMHCHCSENVPICHAKMKINCQENLLVCPFLGDTHEEIFFVRTEIIIRKTSSEVGDWSREQNEWSSLAACRGWAGRIWTILGDVIGNKSSKPEQGAILNQPSIQDNSSGLFWFLLLIRCTNNRSAPSVLENDFALKWRVSLVLVTPHTIINSRRKCRGDEKEALFVYLFFIYVLIMGCESRIYYYFTDRHVHSHSGFIILSDGPVLIHLPASYRAEVFYWPPPSSHVRQIK